MAHGSILLCRAGLRLLRCGQAVLWSVTFPFLLFFAALCCAPLRPLCSHAQVAGQDGGDGAHDEGQGGERACNWKQERVRARRGEQGGRRV